jgi:hypothetical protein
MRIPRGTGGVLDVCAGNDLPDYVFEVGKERWAVEVTELHDYVESDGAQSAVGVEAGLRRVFDDIDRETAVSRKKPYTVFLSGPIRSADVGKIKREAIAHIRENRTGELVCGERQECRVVAGYEPGTALTPVVLVDGRAAVPGGTEIHANIQATVNHAVSRILGRKIPRLRQLRGAFDRLALCLVLEYVFADDGNIRAALADHAEELKAIDTVFLVSGDYVVISAP